jgi:hypothetical protein
MLGITNGCLTGIENSMLTRRGWQGGRTDGAAKNSNTHTHVVYGFHFAMRPTGPEPGFRREIIYYIHYKWILAPPMPMTFLCYAGRSIAQCV